MLDLVIRGGQVVTPGVWVPGTLPCGEKNCGGCRAGDPHCRRGTGIDATGKIVIPGGIEPHAHASMPMPYPGPRAQGLTSGSPR